MNPPNKIPESKLLQDLRETAKKVDGKLSEKDYIEKGNHSQDTIINRFGSWNEGKQKAGLEISRAGRANEYSRDELIQEAQKVAEKLGQEKLFRTEFEKHAKPSSNTVINRFGSWAEFMDEAGLETKAANDIHSPPEKLVNKLEAYLEDKRGRLKVSKIMEEIHFEKPKISRRILLKESLKAVDERDNGLSIRMPKPQKNGRNIFVNNEEKGIWDEAYEQVPEGAEIIIDRVISSHKSFAPRTVVAAIEYILNEYKTQAEITEEHDVSEVSLRKAYQFIADKGFASDVDA